MVTMEVLKDLQPTDVFKYFEEMSDIPRGSGNEKEISDYLVSFAKEHKLEYTQDSAMNVIIRKKASKGYEKSPIIILQGHMDMVCEKNADVKHDFMKDPLKLRIVDDMVMATGTTLGADNGIAVAMGLALLASDKYQHPAIELLVTTSEETGMDGAMALDPKDIEGRTLINIDSEEEGKLLVSCAGGLTAKANFTVKLEAADEKMVPYLIKVRGLKGGHSGMEIDKGRGNANKLMGRILRTLLIEIDYRLSSLTGGSKHNAIPRVADAIILVHADQKEMVKKIVAECEKAFQAELRTPDPDLKLEVELLTKVPAEMLSKEDTHHMVNYLYLVPNGITSMSMDIEGLVESSLTLGVVTMEKDVIEFVSSIRSSVKSLKEQLFDKLSLTAEINGGKAIAESIYPEWAYNPDSKIRPIFEDTYEKMFGEKPIISAIHAGLECGLFAEKFGEIDEISFGPNLYDVHTPNESMSISSVKKTWEILVEVLKNIK